MLVHPWDAPNHDDEWRAVLQESGFGQLIAPGGPDRELPVVVPTHFTFDGGRLEIIDDPAAKAAILTRALNHFEPAHSPRATRGAAGVGDRLLLENIRGLCLTITGVHAKFKYGSNKTVQHRREIAAALKARNGSMDASAGRRMLSRLPGPTDAWPGRPQRPDSHPGSL